MFGISDVVIGTIVGVIIGGTISLIGTYLHLRAERKKEEEIIPKIRFRESFYPRQVEEIEKIFLTLIDVSFKLQTEIAYIEDGEYNEEAHLALINALRDFNKTILKSNLFVPRAIVSSAYSCLNSAFKAATDSVIARVKKKKFEEDLSFEKDLVNFISEARKAIGADEIIHDLNTFIRFVGKELPPVEDHPK